MYHMGNMNISLDKCGTYLLRGTCATQSTFGLSGFIILVLFSICIPHYIHAFCLTYCHVVSKNVESERINVHDIPNSQAI